MLTPIFAVYVLCAATAAPVAVAQETTWIGGPAGTWHSASAWSAGVPGAGRNAAIRTDATIGLGPETPDASISVARLDLGPAGSAGPRLRISGLADRAFTVGQTLLLDGAAVLELDGAACVVEGRADGHLNFRAGTILVRNGRLTTRGTAALRVGRAGVGLLNLEGGAIRAESELIVGGLAGSSGTLDLVEGTADVLGILRIADDPGSRGRVVVSGGSLRATADTARIGDDGSGSLELTGGEATFADVSVGRDATSEGTLRIVRGRMAAGDVSLGRLAGARGSATLTGGDLVLPADTLYVGREGHGELTLEGGTVQASNVVVAASATATGRVRVAGGTLRAARLDAANARAAVVFESGRLECGATDVGPEPFRVGDGVRTAVLVLEAGTHRFPGGLVIAPLGRVEGSGTVEGTVAVLPGGTNALGGAGPAPAAPRLALTVREGLPRISFGTEAGSEYDLESSPSIGGPWSVLRTVRGTGSPLVLDGEVLPAPARIYRVVVR